VCRHESIQSETESVRQRRIALVIAERVSAAAWSFVTLLSSDLRVIRLQRRLGYSIQDGSPMDGKTANAGENFRIIRWLGLLTIVYSQFVEQPFQLFQQ
jgi:hypothetical protein